MPATGLAIIEDAGRLEVWVLTDLTIGNAAAIRKATLSAWEKCGKPELLVVDLASARHIDSSGMGALLEIAHRIEHTGARLTLRGLRPWPRRMLDRTGLGVFFRITDAEEPAARNLSHC
jgi:anti-anti-sigma factor